MAKKKKWKAWLEARGKNGTGRSSGCVASLRACERADGRACARHNCSAMFDKLPVGPFCAAAIFYLPVKCICASARTVGTGNGEKMPQKRPYLVRDFHALSSLCISSFLADSFLHALMRAREIHSHFSHDGSPSSFSNGNFLLRLTLYREHAVKYTTSCD